MLVFTRKKGESLVIGNEIEIKILGVGTGNVKLGITAPRHVSVHRYEVFQAIQRESGAASSPEVVDTGTEKKIRS